MTKVGAWLKRFWGWLVAGVVGLVLLVVGGGLLARRLGRLRDERQLNEAVRELDRIDGQVDEIARQRAETAADRARLEQRQRQLAQERTHWRRVAAAAFEGGEELSDAELESALREVLGG